MVTRDPLDANREDAPREAARLLTRTHRHDEEASILFLLQDGWIDREIGAMGRGRTQKERGEVAHPPLCSKGKSQFLRSESLASGWGYKDLDAPALLCHGLAKRFLGPLS